MSREKMQRPNVPKPPAEPQGEKGEAPSGIDEATLAAVIANGEDVGPLIRSAFDAGKPEVLAHQLRNFAKRKEVEIEELCKVHYEEFILAVDELRNVLSDAYELRNGLSDQNEELQGAGRGLLAKLEEQAEAQDTAQNLGEALRCLGRCKEALDLCAKVNESISTDSYYPALKALDTLERDHLRDLPGKRLREYLERHIPVCRAHIERRVSSEFNDWLVQIRTLAREIGRHSLEQQSLARRREEEMRSRQRQAEEQSRSGQRDMVYLLEVDDVDVDEALPPPPQFDLTPVYRAHYINTCLGLRDQFRDYYVRNRQLQLTSDLQFAASSFLEVFQPYFAQVAGFFIVEDKVFRTAGGVISPTQVDNLWEGAVQKMQLVMEDQFSRITEAPTLLLVKDYVSLLCSTLRRHGYQVEPLLDVVDSTREKYHDLLLADCKRKITDTLANDKYEQMVMHRQYEYTYNVQSFRLQTTDTMPAFPYIAPFSATVPECCRIVCRFIEDSVSFLSYGNHIDIYDIVKKYVDRLITSVLNEALLRVIKNPTVQLPHAMQLAANMTVLERACAFFAEHAAALCGLPSRLAEGPHGALASRAVLRDSQAVAHEAMIKLVRSRIDEMVLLADTVNWMPEEPPHIASAYVEDLLVYLETMLPTAGDILPPDAFEKVSRGIMGHISAIIAATMCSDDVKKLNIYAAMQMDTDLVALEAFADKRFRMSGLDRVPGAVPLRSCFAEVRQMVNLLLSNSPEQFLVPNVREQQYGALSTEAVIALAEKFREAPERSSVMFGRSSAALKTGAVSQTVQREKRKLLEALAKKLKEMAARRGQNGDG